MTDIEILAELALDSKVRALHRKQVAAVVAFRTGLARVIRLHDAKQTHINFDRGEWTFRIEGHRFSAVLRGDWVFPGACQVKIDRIIRDAGYDIEYNPEDGRAWVAALPIEEQI